MEEHGRGSARRPGAVPDIGDTSAGGVAGGTDTDGDGVPDTVLSADGSDLLVGTDLDLDGFVDRVLRIGLDGAVRVEPPTEPAFGSAPAEWPGLLGGLFGPDP